MNYEKFYKMAGNNDAAANTTAAKEPPATVENPKPKATVENPQPKATNDETWKSNINGTEGYNNQLKMLALLAGSGALTGYLFSAKKKKLPGAIFGGASFPAMYLAYLAARRNGILSDDLNKWYNKYPDKVINKVNSFGDDWFKGSGEKRS